MTQLGPIAIDEAVREGDLIAGALCVIHLPGKSTGEIGLYFDPAHHSVSHEMGGILLLGDAIIGNPPGGLTVIPEPKLDDPSKLKRSLRKLLDYDFDVLLLLCDGRRKRFRLSKAVSLAPSRSPSILVPPPSGP